MSEESGKAKFYSGLVKAVIWSVVLSIIILFSVYQVASRGLWIFMGSTFFLLAVLCFVILKIHGEDIRSVLPDIIFGAMDTGLMTIFAVIGAAFEGVLGAVVGAAAGDAVTDVWAGSFEGKAASVLRERNISEDRRPFATAVGKVSGCLIGGGTAISVIDLMGVL